MSSSSRTRGLVAVLVIALLGLVGCGISTDTQASPLDTDSIPESLLPGRLPTPTPMSESAGNIQTIYMVGPNDRLFEVFRDVPAEPNAVFQTLLIGPTTAERRQRIGTEITRSTALAEEIDFNPLFQLATVTLEPDSLAAGSREQLLGFGQIVFTLTELEGIESVLFETKRDGVSESLRVQTDGGGAEPGTQVQRADYASIDPATNLIAFPDDSAEELLPTPTPQVPKGPVLEVAVWMLDSNDQLTPVTRSAERSGLAMVIALFNGLNFEEEERELRSAIPDNSEVRRVVLVDNTAVVDLPPGTLPPIEAGDDRVLAVAQIVYTLTGLSEIERVVFTIDGVPTPMETQNGLSSSSLDGDLAGLRRVDYEIYALEVAVLDRPTPTLTPTPDPAAGLEPEPTPTPVG